MSGPAEYSGPAECLESQEQKILKRQQRENVLKCKKDAEELLALKGKKLTYPNQKKAADEILKAYDEGAVVVVLIAQPGTGKTGTAQEVMIQMATNTNNDKMIMTKDILTCTGMSDKDWEDQFKDKLLPPFKDNVFHRQKLVKQIHQLSSLKNALIIPDECHAASGSKMTLAKLFSDAGLLDVHVLQKNNIKYLEISATPGPVLQDLKKWGSKCRIVKIVPGASYKGFQTMLDEGRIINSPTLEEPKDYEDLLRFLIKRYEPTTKKFFLFRLYDQAKIILLKQFGEEFGMEFLQHNSDDRIDEIDDMMKEAPIKNTLIVIKGFWRAAKRLVPEHVGATYEMIPKKRDVAVTGQGLTGRFCDNYEYSGDHVNANLRPLHYCDKEAIEEYMEWFNHGCDYNTSVYSSRSISSNGKGNVTSKKTKMHPSRVNGLEDTDDSKDAAFKKIKLHDDTYVKKFKVYEGNDDLMWEKAHQFYENIRGKRIVGKSMPKKVEDYYHCSDSKGLGLKNASTFNHLDQEKWSNRFQLKKDCLTYAHVFVGYENVKDPTEYTIFIKYVELVDTPETREYLAKYHDKEENDST